MNRIPAIVMMLAFVGIHLANCAPPLREEPTGARIDETHLSVIGVSAEFGSDSNPGTKDHLVKSLFKAISLVKDNLRAGIPTCLLIYPGIYCESGFILDSAEIGGMAKETPLIIKSTSNAGVIWNGAKPLTGWTTIDSDRGIFCAPWGNLSGDTGFQTIPNTQKNTPLRIAGNCPDGATTCQLSWISPEGKNFTGYNVYRSSIGENSTNFNTFALINQKPIPSTTLKEISLPDIGKDDVYFVRAVDSKGVEDLESNMLRISWVIHYIPNQLGRRFEMVFDGDRSLRQVGNREDMGVGTFWIDETNGKIYVQVSDKGKIPDRISVAGGEGAVSLLELIGKNNVAIRGIRFIHAANRAWNSGALVVRDADNILIENNSAIGNNGAGFHLLNIAHLTFSNNASMDNGSAGVLAGSGNNQIWQRNILNNNGWRATGLGGQNVWFDAGIKHGFGLRNAVFRNNQTSYNQCIGFWLDTDVENILIEGLSCENNLREGMWWEGSRGPCLVKKSRFVGNKGSGILIGDSGGLTLENNLIADNSPSQIAIAVNWMQNAPGRPIRDCTTGIEYRAISTPNTWVGNSIAALQPDQMLVSFAWGNVLSYQAALANLYASNNLYWHPSRKDAFQSPIAGKFLSLTLSQWGHLLSGNFKKSGQEKDSKWENPFSYENSRTKQPSQKSESL